MTPDRSPTLGIGGHHLPNKGRTDEWLTPPSIISALGEFDLDPCSPVDRPWDTAKAHYTILDDGITRDWHGRVWLNPPYGPELGRWLSKMAAHNCGTALVFARTETDAFHRSVWPKACAVLFIAGRLHFYDIRGNRAKANSGAPSVLVAYGITDKCKLKESGIEGRFVELDGNP